MPNGVRRRWRHSAVLEQDVGGHDVPRSWPTTPGSSPGNADTVLIADFPDAEAYSRYAADPVHQAVLTEHVRPFLATRSAVQYRF